MSISQSGSSVASADSSRGRSLSVCCVLINWNGWQDTVPCLESLALQDYSDLHVIVVDNDSSDDSVQRIRSACPAVEVIEAGANLGFAGGCNVGIRRGLELGADWIWLLNNDTIVPADTLTKLVAAGAPERVGIVGSVLRYLHDPAQIQAWGGGRISTWTGYSTHFSGPAAFDEGTFLTFASVLIRRAVLEQVGLLDERYFMYFDDSDFCLRTRKAGWELTIAPDTAVLHKEGGSIDSKRNPLIERIVTTSGLRFLKRHSALPPVAMSVFVLLKWAKRGLRGDLTGVRAVSMGIGDWWHDRATAFRGES